jgi:hypothetical protein
MERQRGRNADRQRQEALEIVENVITGFELTMALGLGYFAVG